MEQLLIYDYCHSLWSHLQGKLKVYLLATEETMIITCSMITQLYSTSIIALQQRCIIQKIERFLVYRKVAYNFTPVTSLKNLVCHSFPFTGQAPTNQACRSEYLFVLTSKCIPILKKWKCYNRCRVYRHWSGSSFYTFLTAI